jgi:hypothetical protein
MKHGTQHRSRFILSSFVALSVAAGGCGDNDRSGAPRIAETTSCGGGPLAPPAARIVTDDRKCQMGICLVYSRDVPGGFGTVAGVTDDDLWMGGGAETIYRLQGDTLQDYSTFCNRLVTGPETTTEDIVTAIFPGNGPSDVVAVSSNFVQDIDGLVYGQLMRLFHWDGTTWLYGGGPDFPTIGPWRSPSGALWIGSSDGRLMMAPNGKLDRADFTEVANPVTKAWQITAVWGDRDDHLYAGTSGGQLLEMSGTTWTTIAAAPGEKMTAVTVGPIAALSGTAGHSVWATAPTGIYEITPAGRSLVKAGNYIGVSAVSDTDVWAVGPGGIISHFDGAAWTDTTWTWDLAGDAPTLVGVRASAHQMVAVGDSWTILRATR